MSNKIEELKTALGPGARANKYLVNIAVPDSINTSGVNLQTIETLCLGSSIPSKTIGQIETYNQGRKFVQPGDTSYPNTWALTFYNTEDHAIRRFFLEWQRSIDHFQDNVHSGVPAKIMTNLKIFQLDSFMQPTVEYTFHNCWPQDISEISVGSDQQDTIQQFTVTFSFTDWVVGNDDIDKPTEYYKPTKNVIA